MDIPWTLTVLALLAGVVAGVINTLAGSGSLVTLPMLVFLGLPAHVANGTNRIGVVVQSAVGLATYRRSGAVDLKGSHWLVIPSLCGAAVGAGVAVVIDESSLNLAIGVVMVVMLAVILVEPKRWLREVSEPLDGRPNAAMLAVFFCIGVYGGFIQAGVGVMLLAALVLGAHQKMVDANAIKLMIILVFSLVALVVFIIGDQVDWWLGSLLALGQSVGAWGAARFATRHERADVWVRRLLIAVVVVSIAKFFGLLDLVLSGG